MKRVMILALVIICMVVIAPEAKAQPEPPNLIIFILDDAGFGNLSPYNSDVDYTPNIQALADTGTIYERWYTATSWCIPTRYALLTGQAPTPEMIAADPGRKIDPAIVTLPEYLQAAGYATGHFGKWHVTADTTGQDALDAGFDVSYSWSTLPQSPSLYDRVETTKKFTIPTVEWIRQTNGPFFAYVAFSAPHTPHLGTFEGLTGQGLVADSYYGIDWAIGEILRQVEIEGGLDNTLVIVLSDNGPQQPLHIDPATGEALAPPWLGPSWIANYPDVDNPARWEESSGENNYGWLWRPSEYDSNGNRIRPTSKGSIYEQGVRVPAIVKWPVGMSHLAADNQLRWTADIYATMLQLAGGTMLPPVEGRSLIGDGHNQLSIYHHPNWGEGLGALVEARWKYHLTGELYDLDASTEEVDDVSGQYPEVVSRLQEQNSQQIYLPIIQRSGSD